MTYASRYLRSLLGLAVITVFFTALGLSAPLRLATLAPKDTSFDKALRRMGQTWKKETNGKVELMVYAGGSQGSESELIKKMRINRLHAALLTGIGLSEIDESAAVFQKVPLLYRSLEELEYVMKEMAPVMEERIREKGFVVLSWIDSGWVRVFSKNEILTPSDMAKSKLFTWSGDPKQTDLLKKIGFRPVAIDSTEIVSSMTTGLIDTVPMPPFYALATQTYNTAPHMLNFNYAPITGAIVISEKMWLRFSEEDRKAMKAAAIETGKEMTASGREESEASIRVMRDTWGLKVSELDDASRDQWQTVAKEAYDYIRGNTVPAEVWDKMVQTLEEYRSAN
jgi:TRAP-type C4-dicarboxylate transport system substrate-binding protein|tara:strand:- start:2811 stop:3827 length:1017 start_codon:yes stop_codon:yes gene_type:complete